MLITKLKIIFNTKIEQSNIFNIVSYNYHNLCSTPNNELKTKQNTTDIVVQDSNEGNVLSFFLMECPIFLKIYHCFIYLLEIPVDII